MRMHPLVEAIDLRAAAPQAAPNEVAFPSAFDEQEQTHSCSALWVRVDPERAPNWAFAGGHERQLFPAR